MIKNNFQLILGSASPRRAELLKYTFCPFQILTCDIEEVSSKSDVSDWVMDIAEQKAGAVLKKAEEKFNNPLVLGADTIVVCDGLRLGKPIDREDARTTLSKLSGREHEVLTGVCLKSLELSKTFYSRTKVVFDEISPEVMNLYLNTNEAYDKAGSYGIQAYGLAFVDRINGSYSNVVGLPVNQVIAQLESFIKEIYSEQDWRSLIDK